MVDGTRFGTDFGSGARPSSGATSASRISFGRGGGQVEYRWSGNKVIEQLGAAANRALQRAANDAKSYWDDTIWAEADHPYMTGKERDAGRFLVFGGGGELNSTANTKARLVGFVDLTEDYPRYVEFGTSKMAPQYPLRRTMDWVAPRIRRYLVQELRAALQGGQS